VVESNLLEQKANNYLVAVVAADATAGLALVDITTSEFAVTELPAERVPLELERVHPSELLFPKGVEVPRSWHVAPVREVDPRWFDPEPAREALLRHLEASSLEAYGCAGLPIAVAAAGAVLAYLGETQKTALQQVTGLSTYSTDQFMTLDPQTRRNLELFEGGRWGDSTASLLSVLDNTRTPMGGRLLRRWVGQPLLDRDAIAGRHDAVEWFHQRGTLRARLGALLSKSGDLERLCNRVRGNIAGPRELQALRRSLELGPLVRDLLTEGEGGGAGRLAAGIHPCAETVALIGAAIADDPPASLGDGDVIKRGFNDEMDTLRDAGANARAYLAGLEQKERERTGIKGLKVGYNRVFGYYIEVSRANMAQVPQDYIRKQTLVGGERFITPELKEYEILILNGQERIHELEASLFRQVCQQIAGATEPIMETAGALAEVDALLSLAEAAARHGYTRPVITEGGELAIVNGRHPVVERRLGPGAFVPNDTTLSNRKAQIMVLTGPNMAGKSTYLRQVGLIVLMAQIGSFVPADSVRMGVVDRVFTRVGLQDDLTAGQSTFMVEMVETAAILNNATPRSLIILDEIGRGTSTYDGMAIARAAVEYLHNHPRLGAKTLFATHYHELTDLARVLPRVVNYNVAVAEDGEKVAFLHRIVPGGADRSYGVQVARLAGMPRPVITRAQELLQGLENGERPRRAPRGLAAAGPQLPLFTPSNEVLETLKRLDVASLTPLEAITKLFELQAKARAEIG
jgi:DNA mismatch repair protein MutS